jgi:hypothetical protein
VVAVVKSPPETGQDVALSTATPLRDAYAWGDDGHPHVILSERVRE